MRAQYLLAAAALLLLILLPLNLVGCRCFDDRYTGIPPELGYPPGEAPEECPAEGGQVVTRLVRLRAIFFPDPGTPEYSVVFGFDPIDPLTGVRLTDPATGDPIVGRRIAAPDGALDELDDGRWRYRFSACILTGSYRVTSRVRRIDVTPETTLFESYCDGDLPAIENANVRFRQQTAGGPYDADLCFDVP